MVGPRSPSAELENRERENLESPGIQTSLGISVPPTPLPVVQAHPFQKQTRCKWGVGRDNMLTDHPPHTHTPRKGAELQRGSGGQSPGLGDMAPPLPQSPWRRARSAGPASFAAYSASLLPWQQGTAGRDGDGSEYRIGQRLWVLGKAREADFLSPFTPRPCLIVRVCLSSASNLSLCFSLSFFVPHSGF